MEMSGEYRIPAPRERVWEALNDPAILKLCIPGAEELHKLSDTEFTAKVTAKIGAIKATFTGSVTLSDIDAPNGYTIADQGQGAPRRELQPAQPPETASATPRRFTPLAGTLPGNGF